MESSIAKLPILSFQAIVDADKDECAKLLSACRLSGIFYVDLGPASPVIFEVVNKLYDAGQQFFDLPLEDKMTISRDKLQSYFGYKPVAYNVVDAQGTPDHNEVLNISKDELLHHEGEAVAFSHLGTFGTEMTTKMSQFTMTSHWMLTTILERLSASLQISKEDDLVKLHDISAISEDHMRLVKYSYSRDPEREGRSPLMLEPHTDFGTLTLLFTDKGGLQVRDADSDSWHWVEPKPGMAVVNIGDALVKFTGGLLRSILHQVVNPPGISGVKYSLGYFLRPSTHVLLRALESPLIERPQEEHAVSSKAWQDERVLASKIGVFKGEDDWHKLRGTAVVWDA